MTTSDAQVEGLSANVVFVPSEIGRKMGELTVEACAEAGADPCEVGYIDAFGQIPLDISIRAAFDAAIAANPAITVVAEGMGMFNPASGPDRRPGHARGAAGHRRHRRLGPGHHRRARGRRGRRRSDHPVQTIGYGGGEVAIDDVAAGVRYATVMQMPATEGRLAVEHLISAIRSGEPVPGVDPVSELPNEGIVTQETAAEFTRGVARLTHGG